MRSKVNSREYTSAPGRVRQVNAFSWRCAHGDDAAPDLRLLCPSCARRAGCTPSQRAPSGDNAHPRAMQRALKQRAPLKQRTPLGAQSCKFSTVCVKAYGHRSALRTGLGRWIKDHVQSHVHKLPSSRGRLNDQPHQRISPGNFDRAHNEL